MLFDTLCDTIDKLKKTRSRLEMVSIISNYFNLLKEDSNLDLKHSLYFLYGKINSEIKSEKTRNLGIAERQLISVISENTGVKIEEVSKVVKKYGDVGEASEKIALSSNKKMVKLDTFFLNTNNNDKKKYTISDIYFEIEKLSNLSGKNSNKDKNTKLISLISNMKPNAIKYLFNIITGTLRTGASIKTLIESLAVSFLNSKEYKEEIENAYYLNPDIGEIGILCKEKGIEGIRNVKINIGTPIKMMLASRVNLNEIKDKLGIPFISEYKYDGERVQVHKEKDVVTLFSRHMKDITLMYPDVIKSINQSIAAEKIIIEGEIVAMNKEYDKMLPFQVVSKRRRKHQIEEYSNSILVSLFVFDILYINDVNMMNKPLDQRREKLKEIIQESETIQIAKGKLINTDEEMVEYFNKAREEGAEGIMNKTILKNSVYSPGNRGFSWIKLKGIEGSKMLDTIDVVIIGASYGKGKRNDILSSFLVAVYHESFEKFELFTKIGSGFTETTLSELTDKLKLKKITDPFLEYGVYAKDYDVDFFVKPEIVIEIMGDELTKSQNYTAGSMILDHGLSIRFPIFKGFREDKTYEDVTTVEEIIEMFENQSG